MAVSYTGYKERLFAKRHDGMCSISCRATALWVRVNPDSTGLGRAQALCNAHAVDRVKRDIADKLIRLSDLPQALGELVMEPEGKTRPNLTPVTAKTDYEKWLESTQALHIKLINNVARLTEELAAARAGLDHLERVIDAATVADEPTKAASGE